MSPRYPPLQAFKRITQAARRALRRNQADERFWLALAAIVAAAGVSFLLASDQSNRWCDPFSYIGLGLIGVALYLLVASAIYPLPLLKLRAASVNRGSLSSLASTAGAASALPFAAPIRGYLLNTVHVLDSHASCSSRAGR
jgi:hypothetical protein